jgi:hypothetical protein
VADNYFEANPALRCKFAGISPFFYAIPRASFGRGVLSRKNSRSTRKAFHCDLG